MSAGWNFHNTYAELPGVLYTRLDPVPVKDPELLVLNEGLARDLGLDLDRLRGEEGAAVFAGNRLPEGAEPLAQAYAGHQFGGFTILGDGRAILLGEQITPAGERFDIQLKGSGRTPYSRGGDGRAALGPMLREYIISEAMHALGIPTTRSLAVATTGEAVVRETFLPGAVLTRVASSHLRVGTFQYAAFRGGKETLQALADYALRRHDPDVDRDDPRRFEALLRAVVERQARLVVAWQLVGFVHGVMNTDNVTISGETIDYGPCAFMDAYDPATVFSSIDTGGRYAYGNQPGIAGWNLARFAEALLPVIDDDQERAVARAQDVISEFPPLYHRLWLEGMRAKLGWAGEEDGDKALVDELLELMQKERADFTNTFRALTLDRPEDIPAADLEAWRPWLARWKARQRRQPGGEKVARRLMRRANPGIIPRNHQVEAALAAAVEEGDPGPMRRLMEALADPFGYGPEQAPYVDPAPETAHPYVTFCGT